MNSNCKRIFVVATLVTALGGAAFAASIPPTESFKVLCEGTNKLPPIYVAYIANGAFERLNVIRDDKSGQLRGGYVPVEQAQINSICAKGQAVSAAPKPLTADGDQAKVWTEYSLPSSFTIATYYGLIFGNFWVPGYMPSSHEAHLASYDLYGNYFRSSKAARTSQIQCSLKPTGPRTTREWA